MRVLPLELMMVLSDKKEVGKVQESFTIAKTIEYTEVGISTHYARWHGVTNALDLLPGGSLYLSDDFGDAIRLVQGGG